MAGLAGELQAAVAALGAVPALPIGGVHVAGLAGELQAVLALALALPVAGVPGLGLPK